MDENQESPFSSTFLCVNTKKEKKKCLFLYLAYVLKSLAPSAEQPNLNNSSVAIYKGDTMSYFIFKLRRNQNLSAAFCYNHYITGVTQPLLPTCLRRWFGAHFPTRRLQVPCEALLWVSASWNTPPQHVFSSSWLQTALLPNPRHKNETRNCYTVSLPSVYRESHVTNPYMRLLCRHQTWGIWARWETPAPEVADPTRKGSWPCQSHSEPENHPLRQRSDLTPRNRGYRHHSLSPTSLLSRPLTWA